MSETLGHLQRAQVSNAYTSTSPKPVPAKAKRKVLHYGWLEDMTFARGAQVEYRALCGVWQPPVGSDSEPLEVDCSTRGGVVVIETMTRDCRNCVRVLTTHYARRIR